VYHLKTGKEPKTIEEYIAAQPPNVQPILQKIRKTIHEAAPEAEETISYRMPAFKQGGVLVWFASFKNHIGFFPKASGIEAFKERLAPYKTSKGTAQFPLGQPLPFDLVADIVRFRVKEQCG
jgi:uncharacterized protein YdhG (YjbR/CyaY superfamily)